MKCYQKIGFATQFYTLWDVREVPQYFTDAYGNHHLQRINMEYYYHKNISKDLDKAQELYPGVGVDENLRDKTRSFTITGTEKNLTPGILKFGKYSGYSLIEIVEKDLNYVLWLLENADGVTRGICAILPQVLEYRLNKQIESAAKTAEHPVAVSGMVEVEFIGNPNTNLTDMFDLYNILPELHATYKDKKSAPATIGGENVIRIIMDEVKYVSGKYPYFMGSVGGKIQRLKGKKMTLNLTILHTQISEDGCTQIAIINE